MSRYTLKDPADYLPGGHWAVVLGPKIHGMVPVIWVRALIGHPHPRGPLVYRWST